MHAEVDMDFFHGLIYSASFREDLSQGDNALISLGDIPLIIISSKNPDMPNMNNYQKMMISRIWLEMQAELAALSTDSQQIFIDSGHDIVTEKPQIIIDSIRDIVLKVREKSG